MQRTLQAMTESLTTAASTSCSQEGQEQDQELLQSLQIFQSQAEAQGQRIACISAQLLTQCYDRTLSTPDLPFQLQEEACGKNELVGQFFLPILQQLIRCVEGQPILMDLVKEIFEEKENAKIQKKINICKAKLMQLEDLFEAFIIQSLLSPSSSSASEMVVEKGEEEQNVAKGKEGAMWWFISQCIEQDSRWIVHPSSKHFFRCWQR
eukprot:scaffold3512_cov223-Ochromonas_danica.AAC.3